MTGLHEEVSTQQIRMKFIAHKPLQINSWGKDPYHVVVYSRLLCMWDHTLLPPASNVSVCVIFL